MQQNTISVPLSGKIGAGKTMLIDAADAHLFEGRSVHPTTGGYASLHVGGRKVLAHRLIMNPADGMHIDHINHAVLDNRRANLRVCTSGENTRNQPKKAGEFKGVTRVARSGRWLAVISCGAGPIPLGYFTSSQFAADVYDVAAFHLHGEFAYLNTPGPVTKEANDYLFEYFGPRWRVTSPSGEVTLLTSLEQFAIEHGLRSVGMLYVSQGKYRQHKGWKCEKISSLPSRRLNIIPAPGWTCEGLRAALLP